MYLILNFKTYEQATGKESVELAGIVHDAGRKFNNVQIILCPQLTDIYRIKQSFPDIILWAQHVDPLQPGRNTGWVTPLAIKDAGATGALVNHSEHVLIDEMNVHTIDALHSEKLQSCLCIPNSVTLEHVQQTAASSGEFYTPSFVLYEPPELVGGDYSAVDSEQHLPGTKRALEAIKAFNSIPLLGAGIKDPSDITKAVRMGYEGVGIASGFVKSADPAKFLQQVLQAFPG